METKANYTIVGMFTVLVFAAAFGFVYWIARTGNVSDAADLDIVIEGSVTGLGIGSPVLFNGIAVGKVTELRFDPKNPKIVIAHARVRGDLPITASTTAVLSLTGLTGVTNVEFAGGDVNQPTVFDIARIEGRVATVTADPSALNNLLVTAQDIFARSNSVLMDIEGFVAEVRAPLTQTFKNTTKITDALAANSEKIDVFMASIGDLGAALSKTSEGLNKVLASTDKLIASVSPEDVKAIVTNVRSSSDNIKSLSDDLKKVGPAIDQMASVLNEAGPRITKSFDKVDTLLSAVDGADVSKAVKGFADAGEAVSAAAKDVEVITKTFAEKKADVDVIIANARQMTERLNAASVRVDGVLAKVDGFLGDSSADSIMDDVKATLAAYRKVADTLNGRLDNITAGLDKFSNRGLDDVQALINETRRSVQRIEGAITNIESNPQQLLFGGEGDVKRFDGRQRR